MKTLSKTKQKVKSANDEAAVHNAAQQLSQDQIFEQCVVPTFGVKFKKRLWYVCEAWAHGNSDHALRTLKSPGYTPTKWLILLRFFLRHHPGLPAALKESKK